METKQPLLMTGATGLVGSRIVEMLANRYEVSNIDLATGVDITDPVQVENYIAAHPAPYLIHLAAFTNTQEAFKQSGDKDGICYRVNVTGTGNIAAACRAHDTRIIHISTDFIFDGKNPPAKGYAEDSPRSPLEWYGETKALAEETVENSGAEYAIVRIAYPYRAEFGMKPDLIAKIRDGLSTGHLPPQFTDTLITPTFIDDIADGIRRLMDTGKTGIYHFTGSTILSPYDLAVTVAGVYGLDETAVKKGSLQEYLAANPRPFSRYSAMNNEKASAELGMHFATVAEGLAIVKSQQETE